MHQPASEAEAEVYEVVKKPLVVEVGPPGLVVEEEAFVGQQADHKDYLVDDLGGSNKRHTHTMD